MSQMGVCDSAADSSVGSGNRGMKHKAKHVYNLHKHTHGIRTVHTYVAVQIRTT